MNSRISKILDEIHSLEEELEAAIKSREDKYLYPFEGRKIQFEHTIEENHRKLKIGVISWLRKSHPLNALSAPVIYSMIVPFALLDLTITVYQMTCFPLYKINNVRRNKFIIIDRQHLSYLNCIEKFNCVYCGYVNGLIAYSREIVARTEQYWCPIKHAKKLLSSHRRYTYFSDFGNSSEYHQHLKYMRDLVSDENS